MGEQYEITSSSCSNVASTLTNANSYTITNVNPSTITYGDLYKIAEEMSSQYCYSNFNSLTTLSETSSGSYDNLVENSIILKINIKKKNIKLNFTL